MAISELRRIPSISDGKSVQILGEKSAMMRSQPGKWPSKWRFAAPIFASALTLAGCSSVPPPTSQMAHARTAIANARDDGAGALARQRLQAAEQKYSSGQAAMQKGGSDNNELAGRLFDEAEADAQYASASALAQKAQSAAVELQQKQQEEQMPARSRKAM
jgi:hypothetical protein